ncbi:hypothetical protein MAR_017293 [Mya arenaria]|uniref:Uncharacterized protein n=1 Tax=Mya arenaria TaxID=6604 RepID=A0ABY7EBT3_MYAAR|nr:hypothetical protein MAR_017293 [Mya arenaria]
MRSLDKRFSLTEAEGRFQKACDQIVLLNHRLGECVRNMYYDFAYSKADRVAELRRELFDESVEIVSGSDSEYSSDDLE